jgi:hypothetical protein
MDWPTVWWQGALLGAFLFAAPGLVLLLVWAVINYYFD